MNQFPPAPRIDNLIVASTAPIPFWNSNMIQNYEFQMRQSYASEET